MKTDCLNTDVPARRTSRKIVGIIACLLILASRGAAQRTAADSLEARLRTAEAAIATLQAQIAEQAGSGVQTRSRMRLEFNGRILMNAFHNSRRVNNVDNPQFAADVAAPPGRGGGIAIRQTQLGLVVTAPEVLDGSFTGDVDVDFYGGQMASGGGRTFPLLRLRTARAVVRWSNAHLLLGQESPLVSALNPVTVAAIGTPAFATAGNLWLWLPQARVGVERGGGVRFGVQAAVLAPTSGDPATLFDTDNDVAERSQRPFVQARASAKWGSDITGEIGCGIHQGWLMPASELVESKAVACDLLVPVVEWLEMRGEFFSGQALRGLGGGGIGQSFEPGGAPPQTPLETKGGWLQLNLRAPFNTRFGAGCGGDHPEPVAARRRNDACAGYAMIRPGPLFFGAELRRLRTEYVGGRVTNDHVTLAAGFEF